MTTKEILHRLVDELPDSEADAARRYLEYLRNMGDPLLKTLLETPEDDEPILPDDDKQANEAWQEYLLGKAISAEEAKRKLLS